MRILNKFSELKYFDLFSGIGGFRLGADRYFKEKKVPGRCVGYCEMNKYAVKTYQSNFHTQNEIFVPNVEDLTLLNSEKNIKMEQAADEKRLNQIRNLLPSFDILFAGFPCQPFSIFGNKQGFNDLRGNLFFHILAILNAIRPSFLMLENVKGLRSIGNGSVLKTIIEMLQKNYNVYHWILNSADYSIPQIRRRIFIVGVDKKLNYFNDLTVPPRKIALKQSTYPTAWHLLERKTLKKYYLSEKIKKTILSNGTGRFFYISKINQLIARPLCKTMHKMHRASQDNYYSDDFINGTFDEKSWKVNLSKSGSDQIRRITPLEAFRLQGFPDSFLKKSKMSGLSDSQLYMQAGNAVSVQVVRAVLEHLLG